MILCAAIKFHIEETDCDVIVPGRRHGDIYKIMKGLGYGPKKGYKEIEQGFITTAGFFLNRSDAFHHALECGQISQTTQWYKADHEGYIHIPELFSEDLY